MKNIIYGIFAFLVASVIYSCNGGSSSNKNIDSLTNKWPVKKDSIDPELYNYLHIKTIPVNGTRIEKMLMTPEQDSIFKLDSTAFASKYTHSISPVLSNSDSFPISIWNLYHNLQRQLGLQDIMEAGTDKYNGVRIYPALEISGGKKVLYIALMGEKATAGPLTFITMLDAGKRENAYTVKNSTFSLVTNGSVAYRQMKIDIAAFQTFWLQSEGVPERDSINRDMCFSISEYYEMLNLMDPGSNMIKDTTTGSGKYDIVLYPCLKDKRLRFVIKGMQNKKQIPNSDIFNNMDVCPTKCPTNEL